MTPAEARREGDKNNDTVAEIATLPLKGFGQLIHRQLFQ